MPSQDDVQNLPIDITFSRLGGNAELSITSTRNFKFLYLFGFFFSFSSLDSNLRW
jgi:hypothetical protein